MNDVLLIHEDKEYLKYCLIEIDKILKKYKLEFNIKKTRIDNIKNGIDFLGFRFYIINNKVIMKLRNNTKKRFKKKIKNSDNCLASYIGHLKWGSCNNLLYKKS